MPCLPSTRPTGRMPTCYVPNTCLMIMGVATVRDQLPQCLFPLYQHWMAVPLMCRSVSSDERHCLACSTLLRCSFISHGSLACVGVSPPDSMNKSFLFLFLFCLLFFSPDQKKDREWAQKERQTDNSSDQRVFDAEADVPILVFSH